MGRGQRWAGGSELGSWALGPGEDCGRALLFLSALAQPSGLLSYVCKKEAM